ncbi:MAG TPA: CoA transferase, partial [Trebonia sp.]|nr:CoA transferase [Trebonia sp.]
MTDTEGIRATEELPAPGTATAPGPLAGVRVLEVGDEHGDYAGLLCAGLGATVIKVEPPEGSPSRRLGPFYPAGASDVVGDGLGGGEARDRSLYFWGYNRGKRSVVLDLDSAAGRTGLDQLLSEADVLID